MVPSAALSPKQAAWMKALDRAKSDRVVVYRAGGRTLGVANVAGGAWVERPYSVAITGPCACDLACDCPAGRKHQLCKHVAAATFARKHGVYAVQPVAASATYRATMAAVTGHDLPPSVQAARSGLR